MSSVGCSCYSFTWVLVPARAKLSWLCRDLLVGIISTGNKFHGGAVFLKMWYAIFVLVLQWIKQSEEEQRCAVGTLRRPFLDETLKFKATYSLSISRHLDQPAKEIMKEMQKECEEMVILFSVKHTANIDVIDNK
ncbi:hypothetical protein RB195_004296 [Necator americanus]|uniref:Uncharacterized protein n=1 Tax=Necator americanus TaxID=51031 RepID=A0ABR1BKM0_NECAM